MKNLILLLLLLLPYLSMAQASHFLPYTIVDTGQNRCFDNRNAISPPQKGEAFYGQDAQHSALPPNYQKIEQDIVLDSNTGLYWQKAYKIMTVKEAQKWAKNCEDGGYTDWRVPTIKEVYSLLNFSGVDISGPDMKQLPNQAKPFIDTRYFDFEYSANGPRIIDSQLLSSTFYEGKVMGKDRAVFGLNFADGRIKAYPVNDPRSQSGKQFMVRLVRGNPEYGKNEFKDHQNSTISDLATGLMWSKMDSQKGMNWEKALAWVQERNQEKYLGYSDWRLPNAKELQSIVDYANSPQKNGKAAINEQFDISSIRLSNGQKDYPAFWTSTTHINQKGGRQAIYISFGQAMGYFKPPHQRNGKGVLMDVHGAGAQRSDPKTGDLANFPHGKGPQGDVISINNYIRLVRDL
ncbi:DUF1566 domain-containing protein [Persicobacter diffluens]